MSTDAVLNSFYTKGFVDAASLRYESSDANIIKNKKDTATAGSNQYQQGITAKEEAELRGFLTGAHEGYSQYTDGKDLYESIGKDLKRLEGYKNYEKNSEYLAQDRDMATKELKETEGSKPKWYQRFTLGQEEYQKQMSEYNIKHTNALNNLNEANSNVISSRTIKEYDLLKPIEPNQIQFK